MPWPCQQRDIVVVPILFQSQPICFILDYDTLRKKGKRNIAPIYNSAQRPKGKVMNKNKEIHKTESQLNEYKKEK